MRERERLGEHKQDACANTIQTAHGTKEGLCPIWTNRNFYPKADREYFYKSLIPKKLKAGSQHLPIKRRIFVIKDRQGPKKLIHNLSLGLYGHYKKIRDTDVGTLIMKQLAYENADTTCQATLRP